MKNKEQIEFEIDQINNIKEIKRIQKESEEYKLLREKLMNYAKTSKSTSLRIRELRKKKA